jgi:hypothetical protein
MLYSVPNSISQPALAIAGVVEDNKPCRKAENPLEASSPLPTENRESILKLQESIRQKRTEMGLPKEGPLPMETLLDTIKKNPPIKKLTQFVKDSLAEDRFHPPVPPSFPTPRGRFDKKP